MTDEELRGTFACPICGYDKPHHHPDEQVAAYRADQIRADGWISVAHRNPAESGWYLCRGVRVDPDQYGKKKDFWTPNEKWSQLSWFRWVREGAAGAPEWEIPEVLRFDQLAMNGMANVWSLRNLLGNAVASGAENRFLVFAQPTYWRPLPAPPEAAT